MVPPCWAAVQQEVKPGTAIHLPFREFEAGGVAFGLPVRPRLDEGVADGVVIRRETCSARCAQALTRFRDPATERGGIPLGDHRAGAIHEISRGSERRSSGLDGGDQESFGLRHRSRSIVIMRAIERAPVSLFPGRWRAIGRGIEPAPHPCPTAWCA